MKHLKLISLVLFAVILCSTIYSQSNTCNTLEPICTDVGLNFPAQTGVADASITDPGNNYSCLASSPNPTWYYMEVANAGGIDMNLTAGSDIDFALWGPFSSLAAAQADCGSYGSAIDCSYSTAATENVNVPNAQIGEVYVLLITNYASVSQQITLTQTGGTGATDCSIVDPCTMTFLDANLTPCIAGVFDITGQVAFVDPPTTGTMTVTNCSGDQQVFNAPFNSPINYAINGVVADATAGCTVTATFSDEPSCTISTGTFTEPICTCFMTLFNASISACDGFLNTYDVTGDVEFTNPPSSGNLVIEVNNGTTTYTSTYPLPVTSPLNWDVLGIPADGANITIDAYFSADPGCTIGVNSTAPDACMCTANIGTINASISGVSTNNYVLCFGDQIDLSGLGDFTSPQDLSPLTDGNGNLITYDPGIAYLAYECPPTIFPTNSINGDPCLLGVVAWGNNFSDLNNLGIPSYAGNFTDNTIYYVPITTYSNVDGYYAISINGGPWCYDMGTPFAVQYLPEILATSVEDCFAGTATFTINGGLPAVDGSNFTASNLLPATASFGNSTTTNGGAIVITGLQDGDMYSFDIIDANGCPQTFSGGPFVAAPIANAGNDDTNCSFSYGLSATPSVGAGTWTGAGVTFSPNANTPGATATVTSAGSYTMTWTEDNGGGCADSDDVIVQFSNLSYVDAVVQSTCGSADGEITLTASDGITAYQYSIDNGANFQASGNFTGLMAGNYNVVVQDNIGCQVTGIVSVTDQGGPVINSVTGIDPLCNAGCDGSISINATDATQFSIDNGVTFQGVNAFPNLCPGNYDIVVTNAVGCQAT
jgi:hypothetical protein